MVYIRNTNCHSLAACGSPLAALAALAIWLSVSLSCESLMFRLMFSADIGPPAAFSDIAQKMEEDKRNYRLLRCHGHE
jgi:hypothetical protein